MVSFDYLFVIKSEILNREEFREFSSGSSSPSGQVEAKILVVKDSSTRSIFAHMVTQKGVDEERYAVECLRKDIQWLGHMRLALRSDNEPAIVHLLRESLKELRIGDIEQCMEEHSVAYDSKDNGLVENVCKQVQSHLRTHRSCLESRVGARIPLSHPLMAWLVEHVAWLVVVRQRGTDGRTSYYLERQGIQQEIGRFW